MFRILRRIILYTLFLAAAVPIQVYAQETTITHPAALPAAVKAAESLTPAQQQAVQQELSKTDGQITSQAVEALKASPEFKGLTPEDIAKGKQQLEKKAEEKPKEPAKIEPVKKEEDKPLFDRYISEASPLDVSTKLRPFGYDLFTGVSLVPPQDLPVAADYVIGPGDEINVLLWGRITGQHTLTVSRDGTILFPNIGPLSVAGMTFERMQRFLTQKTKNIIGAEINVTMGRLRSIQVFVLGEVKKPGAYTVSAMSTLTNALMLSGGPTEIGSLRKVELKRNGNKVVTTMDFYDLLLKGDKSKDFRLQNGDVIFVPTVGPIVGVAGNVKRPAIYELKDALDLASVLELAGGIIPTAYTQQIQVERIEKNIRRIIVDINTKASDAARQFKLQDADLVKVFSIIDRDVNVVYLNGNVKRPGKYELKKGMRIKDVIKDETDLLKETYLEYGLVKRFVPPLLEAKLVPFNLGNVLFKSSTQDNVELMPQDAIYVFSKWFFKDKPYAVIEGAVRSGGRFTIDENHTIKDLVLQAGDLTKDAYLKKAELIRVNEKREFKTIYFNLERAMAGDRNENILLQDEDKVIIHSLWEEKWKESVKIEGEIKKPGSYLLTDGMGIRDLLFKSGGETRDTYLEEAELYRINWKTKDVTIIRFNLSKAREGDEANNIKLEDLDRVVVHSIWENVPKQFVSISGEVNKPGQFPYASNMTIRDLVFAAGSLLESAYIDEAEITSQILENNRIVKVEHKKVNLREALKGDAKNNIVLLPYDRVTIKRLLDFGKEGFVNISGEVNFPGKYKIKKNEKLSEVVERAGGYSPNAYLRGVVFTRERVRELQQKGIEEMSQRLERELLAESSVQVSSALSSEEVQAKKVELESKQKFIETFKKLKATGRMTLRLAHLRLLKGSEYDIELEDGDTLFIPKKNSVVNVTGAVMAQSSLVYSPKLDYVDYIESSGGFSRYADKDNIYVLKVDGSAKKLSTGFINWNQFKSRWEMPMFGEDVREIEAGDTIVVPEKLERIAWLREIRDITQILMQMAVTTGVILNLY